jgi:hypothetical protein
MKACLCLAILVFGALPQDSKEDPKKAADLLREALGQAKEGKKRVFLTFGSPG